MNVKLPELSFDTIPSSKVAILTTFFRKNENVGTFYISWGLLRFNNSRAHTFIGLENFDFIYYENRTTSVEIKCSL